MPVEENFWENLMAEQGVTFVQLDDYVEMTEAPNYNVGDVIQGEVLEVHDCLKV